MKRLLVALALAALCAGTAQGGIVNNSGTTAEDSLAIQFQLMDSLWNPVVAVTGDSAWLFVWYPGGELAFTDSVRLLTDAKISVRNLDVGAHSMAFYTYQNAIADVDGAGLEGVYKWTWVAYDSTLSLATTVTGEFQLYATSDFSTFADRVDTNTINLGDTLTMILADVTGINGADGSAWATATSVTTVTGNVDGNVGGNVTGSVGDLLAISGDATAANNLELFFDGTGYIAGNSEIGTVRDVENILSGAIQWASFTEGAIKNWAIDGTAARELADTLLNRETDAMTWAPGSYANLFDNDSTVLAGVKAKTDNLPADPADDSDIDGQLAAIQTGIDSSAAHVSQPGNAYASDSALLVAVNAKTTNLPTDPADDSDVDGQLAAIQTGIDSSAAHVSQPGNAYVNDSTALAGVKAATDQLNFTGSDVQATGSFTLDTAQMNRNMKQVLEDSSNVARNATAADYKGGADSTANHVSQLGQRHATDSTYMDSLMNAIADANKANFKAGSGGSGAQTDTLWVIDTSGTDAVVPSASVKICNSANTANVAWGLSTNSSGYVIYNLDASTSYTAVVARPGFIFPTQTITSGAGATDSLVVQGYNIAISAPGSASLKRVYVDCREPGLDTMLYKGIEVKCELLTYAEGSDSLAADTLNWLVFGKKSRTISRPANGFAPDGTYVGPAGRAIFDIIPNDTYHSIYSDYRFTAYLEGETLWTLTVRLTGTSQVELYSTFQGSQD